MGRPPLERFVAALPRATLFKPAGIAARELEQIGLTVDEVEALRLVDLQGLSHEEAAARLGVSRQTVGRVLEAARRKVADALVNGKALLIGGGAYRVAQIRCCDSCGTRWELEPGQPVDADETCPVCGSRAIRACAGPGAGRGAGRGRCRGGRGRGCDRWNPYAVEKPQAGSGSTPSS
jgi:predicted DNA-binding protein (UPF0251 family)